MAGLEVEPGPGSGAWLKRRDWAELEVRLGLSLRRASEVLCLGCARSGSASVAGFVRLGLGQSLSSFCGQSGGCVRP